MTIQLHHVSLIGTLEKMLAERQKKKEQKYLKNNKTVFFLRIFLNSAPKDPLLWVLLTLPLKLGLGFGFSEESK